MLYRRGRKVPDFSCAEAPHLSPARGQIREFFPGQTDDDRVDPGDGGASRVGLPSSARHPRRRPPLGDRPAAMHRRASPVKGENGARSLPSREGKKIDAPLRYSPFLGPRQMGAHRKGATHSAVIAANMGLDTSAVVLTAMGFPDGPSRAARQPAGQRRIRPGPHEAGARVPSGFRRTPERLGGQSGCAVLGTGEPIATRNQTSAAVRFSTRDIRSSMLRHVANTKSSFPPSQQ
jgi:hypothetical protein